MPAADEPELDERSYVVHETSKVAKEIYRYLAADRRRATPKLTSEQTARAWRVLDILQWSESGGRTNPYIEMPETWKISDIERILGTGDDDSQSTNAAWRRVTRVYEQSSTAAGGRTI